MRRRLGLVPLLGALAVGVPVVSAAPAGPIVALRALEFRFVPREPSARPGEVLVVVRNEGEVEHSFVIDDPAGQRVAEIASIPPEQTERVRATLRAGTYAFYCNVIGHKDLGMHGTLTVRE